MRKTSYNARIRIFLYTADKIPIKNNKTTDMWQIENMLQNG